MYTHAVEKGNALPDEQTIGGVDIRPKKKLESLTEITVEEKPSNHDGRYPIADISAYCMIGCCVDD